MYNPDDPFQQIWTDENVEGGLREMADSLHHSKRMIAHSYMSSMVDMTEIASTFKDVPTDAFVIRATAKAYKATIDSAQDQPLNVSRVFTHGKRMAYLGV